jgi:hypothetical protein
MQYVLSVSKMMTAREIKEACRLNKHNADYVRELDVELKNAIKGKLLVKK